MAYRESFLSPYSKSLLTDGFYSSCLARDFHYLTDFFVNFDEISLELVDLLSSKLYDKAAAVIMPIVRSSCLSFARYSTPEIHCHFIQSLLWLSDPTEFLELHARLGQHDPCERLTIFLRLTALLEFSLGRLYWNPVDKCANNMIELLKSPYLANLCGKNCMLVLSLFFGPVSSMNIRNLCWHGFVSPSDMQEFNPFILPFIFVLLLSIGRQLTNRGTVNLEQFLRPSRVNLLLDLPELKPSVIEANNIQLTKIVQHHHISSVSSVQYVEYIDKLFFATRRRNLDILCLSLICISIILRCEFAAAFDWPEGCLSSEDRFFVTIDGILEFKDAKLESKFPDVRNYVRFAEALDTRVLAILCELLSTHSGPRLKDHLSHGEFCCWKSGISINHDGDDIFSNAAMLVRAALISLLLFPSMHSPSLERLASWPEDYVFTYHPIPLYVQRITRLREKQAKLRDELITFNVKSVPALPNYDSFTNLWVPQTATVTPTIVVGDIWITLSSWHIVSALCQLATSSRPYSILRRLNQISRKHLEVVDSILRKISHFRELQSSDGTTYRQEATVQKFLSASVLCTSYFRWLDDFFSRIWGFWLGGSGRSIETIVQIMVHSTACTANSTRMFDYLERTIDKLTLWISKSQWDRIPSYFENFVLPSPKQAK
ncbi:unnamed protein product [Calicophoron daubneyi]|uniref:DUF4209 domain-containing protein n=1 Tax=Calicophoron daubneyi TaxID=300641 RepID=A0AAV2TBN7_CALDB